MYTFLSSYLLRNSENNPPTRVMPRRLVHRDHYARARWALFIEDPSAETAGRKSSTRTMAAARAPAKRDNSHGSCASDARNGRRKREVRRAIPRGVVAKLAAVYYRSDRRI